jgi:hypothetical protein
LKSSIGASRRNDPTVDVRTAEWKLIAARLYDLRNDPQETTGSAVSFPAVAPDLTGRMKALIRNRAVPDVTAAAPEMETIERLRSLGHVK